MAGGGGPLRRAADAQCASGAGGAGGSVGGRGGGGGAGGTAGAGVTGSVGGWPVVPVLLDVRAVEFGDGPVVCVDVRHVLRVLGPPGPVLGRGDRGGCGRVPVLAVGGPGEPGADLGGVVQPGAGGAGPPLPVGGSPGDGDGQPGPGPEGVVGRGPLRGRAGGPGAGREDVGREVVDVAGVRAVAGCRVVRLPGRWAPGPVVAGPERHPQPGLRRRAVGHRAAVPGVGVGADQRAARRRRRAAPLLRGQGVGGGRQDPRPFLLGAGRSAGRDRRLRAPRAAARHPPGLGRRPLRPPAGAAGGDPGHGETVDVHLPGPGRDAAAGRAGCPAAAEPFPGDDRRVGAAVGCGWPRRASR